MKVRTSITCLFLLNPLALAKSSHPTTELVVSRIVNNEEHSLRALADTGTSSNIILEAYTSASFSKTDDSITTNHLEYNGR
jgi:hypothetical protein